MAAVNNPSYIFGLNALEKCFTSSRCSSLPSLTVSNDTEQLVTQGEVADDDFKSDHLDEGYLMPQGCSTFVEDVGMQQPQRTQVSDFVKPLSLTEEYVEFDVTIFHEKDVQAHADKIAAFLKETQLFEDRSSRIRVECISDITFPLTTLNERRLRSSRIQLILMSKLMLEFLCNRPKIILGRLFVGKITIVLLIGVQPSDVKPMHLYNLPRYHAWNKLVMDELGAGFDSSMKDLLLSDIRSAIDGRLIGSSFRLSVTKIREGENKLYLILDKPLRKDEPYKVYIEQESYKMTRLVNCYAVNPYNIRIVVPEHNLDDSKYLTVILERDEQCVGSQQLKYQSKMSVLHSLLSHSCDPLTLVSQVVHGSNADKFLASSFRTNMQHHQAKHLDLSSLNIRFNSQQEWPTLLHFSCYHGLYEFTSVLLTCPGAEIACRIKNKNSMTPAEVAEIRGFQKLRMLIDRFLEGAPSSERGHSKQRVATPPIATYDVPRPSRHAPLASEVTPIPSASSSSRAHGGESPAEQKDPAAVPPRDEGGYREDKGLNGFRWFRKSRKPQHIEERSLQPPPDPFPVRATANPELDYVFMSHPADASSPDHALPRYSFLDPGNKKNRHLREPEIR